MNESGILVGVEIGKGTFLEHRYLWLLVDFY